MTSCTSPIGEYRIHVMLIGLYYVILGGDFRLIIGTGMCTDPSLPNEIFRCPLSPLLLCFVCCMVCVCAVSPAQLLLEVRHVLVTLCVVRRLGLHKVVQTAQVVGLQYESDGQSMNSGHQQVQCTGRFSHSPPFPHGCVFPMATRHKGVGQEYHSSTTPLPTKLK